MKITIIHGDNSTASINFLKSTLGGFSQKGILISRISKESPLSLMEALSAGDLFNAEAAFVLEEPTKLSDKDIDWIYRSAGKLPGNLLIYNDSQLPLAFVKKLSSVSETKEFKLPRSLFVFLDSFLPGGAGRCVNLLHDLLKKEAPEFIFAVFCKQVRDLYWAKVAPETLAYPSWRVSRLARQADYFSEAKLKKALSSLARIDFSTKTSSQELVSSLDLLIVSLLQ